jgi:uncharacterized protein YhhL (DUF1145 family)
MGAHGGGTKGTLMASEPSCLLKQRASKMFTRLPMMLFQILDLLRLREQFKMEKHLYF